MVGGNQCDIFAAVSSGADKRLSRLGAMRKGFRRGRASFRPPRAPHVRLGDPLVAESSRAQEEERSLVRASKDPPRPFSFAREELKRVWCDIRGGDLSPARIAASVALGAFIGCLPIFGFHLPVVLLLCLR